MAWFPGLLFLVLYTSCWYFCYFFLTFSWFFGHWGYVMNWMNFLFVYLIIICIWSPCCCFRSYTIFKVPAKFYHVIFRTIPCMYFSLYQYWRFSSNPFLTARVVIKISRALFCLFRYSSLARSWHPNVCCFTPSAQFLHSHTCLNQWAHFCSISTVWSLDLNADNCTCILGIYIAPQPFMFYLIKVLYKSRNICFCLYCSIQLASFMAWDLICCHASLYAPSIFSPSTYALSLSNNALISYATRASVTMTCYL